MTLFPRHFEELHGINTSPESTDSKIANTVDRARETITGIVIGGESADYIYNLPEDYVPTQIGSFESAFDFYGVANDNVAVLESAA